MRRKIVILFIFISIIITLVPTMAAEETNIQPSPIPTPPRMTSWLLEDTIFTLMSLDSKASPPISRTTMDIFNKRGVYFNEDEAKEIINLLNKIVVDVASDEEIEQTIDLFNKNNHNDLQLTRETLEKVTKQYREKNPDTTLIPTSASLSFITIFAGACGATILSLRRR